MPHASVTHWEVRLTPEAKQWLKSLSAGAVDDIRVPLNHLERSGPGLRRPLVGIVKGSRHHNMRELRSVGGHLRALFVFDPQRRAIVLLGGDKTNDWEGWYKRNIPLAEKLYDEHLLTIGKEGAWRTTTPRAGGRSAASYR